MFSSTEPELKELCATDSHRYGRLYCKGYYTRIVKKGMVSLLLEQQDTDRTRFFEAESETVSET